MKDEPYIFYLMSKVVHLYFYSRIITGKADNRHIMKIFLFSYSPFHLMANPYARYRHFHPNMFFAMITDINTGVSFVMIGYFT